VVSPGSTDDSAASAGKGKTAAQESKSKQVDSDFFLMVFYFSFHYIIYKNKGAPGQDFPAENAFVLNRLFVKETMKNAHRPVLPVYGRLCPKKDTPSYRFSF
jgi:hypothetical protein